jgi:hypothetical protein
LKIELLKQGVDFSWNFEATQAAMEKKTSKVLREK